MDLEIEKCANGTDNDSEAERGFVWFSYLRLRKGLGRRRVAHMGG